MEVVIFTTDRNQWYFQGGHNAKLFLILSAAVNHVNWTIGYETLAIESGLPT